MIPLTRFITNSLTISIYNQCLQKRFITITSNMYMSPRGRNINFKLKDEIDTDHQFKTPFAKTSNLNDEISQEYQNSFSNKTNLNDDKDLKNIIDIETKLFENSKLHTNDETGINTKNLLKSFDKEKWNKKKIHIENFTKKQNNKNKFKSSSLFNFDQLDEQTFPDSRPNSKITPKKNQNNLKPKKQRSQPQDYHNHIKSEIIRDSETNLTFTKLSVKDPILSNVKMLTTSKKYRDRKQQLVLEGFRLIEEALQCGLKLNTLLFSQRDHLARISTLLSNVTADSDSDGSEEDDDEDELNNRIKTNVKKIKICKVPYTNLKFWSDLTTCPGIMGIFQKPNITELNQIWNRQSIMNISADKHIKQPLPITVICDQIREPNNLGSIIRNCSALSCAQILLLKGCADPWETKALRGGAGGQFRMRIIGPPLEWSSIKDFLPDNENDYRVYVAENNPQKIQKFYGSKNTTDVEDISIKSYNDIIFNDKHIVIVIGGETHGISDEAYNFLSNHQYNKGEFLYIPLAKGIDSLNTSSALAVLLFEIRNQIIHQNR